MYLHVITSNLAKQVEVVQICYFSGTCSQDRSITLYDIRQTGPIRKVTLSMRSNQLAWNPMEANMYTVANEDYQLISIFQFHCLLTSVFVCAHSAAISQKIPT